MNFVFQNAFYCHVCHRSLCVISYKDKLVSWPIILVSSEKKGNGTSPVSTKREILLSASARALIWSPLWKFSRPYLDFLHFIIEFSIKNKQTNKQTADSGKEKREF